MSYWSNLLIGFSIALVFVFFLFRKNYLMAGYNSQLNFPSFVSANRLHDLINRFGFIIILVIAVAVRIWDFGSVPAGFNQDGAMAAVDAKALADYGTDRLGMKYPVHFTAWGYGQMSVLLSYLMVPFIKIAGLDEITARLPILLVSLLGMLAFYGLIKNLLGRTAGLLALFFIAINPWHIMQSRWALDCNLFPHFFLIGCYFLYMASVRKINLVFSMIAFALCMYSYGIAFLTVPVFLGMILVFTLTKGFFSLKDVVMGASAYLLFSGPIWAVMVINFFRLPSIETPFFTIPFFPDSVRSGDILFFAQNIKEQLFNNLNAFTYVVLKQGPDLPWNAIDNFGTYYQFSLPFVLLGLIIITRRAFIHIRLNQSSADEQASLQLIYFMLLAGLIVGVWTGLVVSSVNVNRINIIFYFLILLMVIGVYEILKYLKIISYVLLPIYFVFFLLFCQYYYGTWSREIGPYYFSGMAAALKKAKTIDTPRYYITVNSQGQGARGVSEILTLFHHRIDAKYFQGYKFSPADKTLTSDTIAGNKYGLPYGERYQYINPLERNINPGEPVVYIVNSNERYLFSAADFEFYDFEGYSLIVPHSLKSSEQ